MFKCEYCDFVTLDRLSLGGHKSGHVRRGEIPKLETPIHVCEICNEVFENGLKLFGHKFKHKFETVDFDLVSIGEKRKRVLAEQGNACVSCKLSTWLGKSIPLELDHIDGNPNNETRENLRLLCPNCHAQTDTYCGRNIGRPKSDREKKSYPNYRSLSTSTARIADSQLESYAEFFKNSSRTRGWKKKLSIELSLSVKQIRNLHRRLLKQNIIQD